MLDPRACSCAGGRPARPGEMSPEPAPQTRQRAVLACGLAVLVVGVATQPWIVAALSDESFLEVRERRLALNGISLAGLLFGGSLVLLRRPIAARLVPLLATGVALGLIATLVLAADLFMSYRALTRELPGQRLAGLHEPDALLGWLPKPGGVGYHRLDGNFDVEYRIDAEGFREVPYAGVPERRLWIFGDSFSFGSGVSDQDVYPSRIASAYLNERVRVINAAVTGHGLVQMYGRLRALRERLQPGDLVVFAPISDDLQRSLHDMAYVSQLLFRGQGRSVHFPRYESGRLEAVRIESPWNRLRALLFHAPLSEGLHRFVHRAITGSWQRSVAEARAAIEDARALCAQREVGFLLVFLPRAKELLRGRYEVDVSSFDYVELRPFFPRDEAEIAKLRFPDDNHWSPRGHEIAAGALVAVLLERGLLGPEHLRMGVALPDRGARSLEAHPIEHIPSASGLPHGGRADA